MTRSTLTRLACDATRCGATLVVLAGEDPESTIVTAGWASITADLCPTHNGVRCPDCGGFTAPASDGIRECEWSRDCGWNESDSWQQDMPLDMVTDSEIRRRFEAARQRAVDAGDAAGLTMLQHIHEQWEAGNVPLGNAEIALNAAARRAELAVTGGR